MISRMGRCRMFWVLCRPLPPENILSDEEEEAGAQLDPFAWPGDNEPGSSLGPVYFPCVFGARSPVPALQYRLRSRMPHKEGGEERGLSPIDPEMREDRSHAARAHIRL